MINENNCIKTKIIIEKLLFFNLIFFLYVFRQTLKKIYISMKTNYLSFLNLLNAKLFKYLCIPIYTKYNKFTNKLRTYGKKNYSHKKY